MCGRSYGPRFLFSWPNARISVMGGEQAASTLLAVKRQQLAAQGNTLAPEEEAALTAPILAAYEEESSAMFASARLWDDGIIDPSDTRDVLGLALTVVLRQVVPAGIVGAVANDHENLLVPAACLQSRQGSDDRIVKRRLAGGLRTPDGALQFFGVSRESYRIRQAK